MIFRAHFVCLKDEKITLLPPPPPQGRCTRENCKYLHPPPHLKTQLEINGRNNLIQQKAAAAMLAQQMQFMLPGAQLQPIVSTELSSHNFLISASATGPTCRQKFSTGRKRRRNSIWISFVPKMFISFLINKTLSAQLQWSFLFSKYIYTYVFAHFSITLSVNKHIRIKKKEKKKI